MQRRNGALNQHSRCASSCKDHPESGVFCRNSLGNGKGRTTASKASAHWQGHAEDMDLDTMPARSNTATPGPSDDDMQSKLLILSIWVT